MGLHNQAYIKRHTPRHGAYFDYFETGDSLLFNLKLGKTLSPKGVELLEAIFNFSNT